jgi:23S rRNA (pseudouridine1915-N3)-methyltransferase
MSISLLWTGKTRFSFLKEGISEYKKRISRFVKFEITELRDIKTQQSPMQLIGLEEKQYSAVLKNPSTHIILLDENGKSFNSIEFSKWLDHKLIHTSSDLCFIIGGAYGFSDDFKKKAGDLVSLSPMTMSHQLVRLVFMEQLYRAFTIQNNLPYHHE